MKATSKEYATINNVAKVIRELSQRHHTHQVFSDFVEMAAISLSNAVDKAQFTVREERYLQIVKHYSKEELARFPELLAMLTLILEEAPCDVLGALFHELELHNQYKGQFFTPYNICQMMAKTLISEKTLPECGFLTAQEPACGAGAMVISLAEALKDSGINYQQCLHVTAVDIDPRCVHMAYVQLSLLHIPAIVIHGNTLSLEEFSHWHTPAHIFGFWNAKLKIHRKDSVAVLAEASARRQEENMPMPAMPLQLSLF